MKRRVTKASASGLAIFIVLCCAVVAGLQLLRGTNGDEDSESGATQIPSVDTGPTAEQQPIETATSPPTTTSEATTPPICDCSGDLLNCADFSNPQDAQKCYAYCLSSVELDIHLLDGDENGVVCESVWPEWATPPVSSTPQPTRSPPTVAPQPTSAPVCNCSSDSYNCSSFSSHASAQRCFNYCREQGRGDIHRLDGDNDGSACESLP